ncbi:NnrU family protein [Agrobacterium vitis]|uniref:NnrU family protein n=1 Tax=Rhizobium/Agrobacterium group TaxID=227290 RepID=UPI0012E70B10|nr:MULTISPECIES: NnrU family protein [Rhizobium/Agrobacterium group]MCF1494483.1 NnrU family protein [Allorhizobium ampelinum]MVA45989.1 NnrU family protein [Agrobacterium vitis]
MGMFLLAFSIFLLLHIVPALPGIRVSLIAHIGRKTYLAVYSLLSIAILAWVFQTALAMDFVALWEPAAWQAHITLITAPIGLFLVLAGLFSANPLSVTMRPGADAPGAITAVTRHPVLWGFWLWAAGHMVPNGDLRSVMLFGSFALFAAAGIVMVERRSRKRLGDTWGQLSAGTAILPFAAIALRRSRLSPDRAMAAAALSTGLATLWLLTGGHLALFGADPLLQALPQ